MKTKKTVYFVNAANNTRTEIPTGMLKFRVSVSVSKLLVSVSNLDGSGLGLEIVRPR